MPDNYHHLYCSESDRRENYFDKELNEVIEDYFTNNNINNYHYERKKY